MVGCSEPPDGELVLVEPGVHDRFQFPYFLFIPDQAEQQNPVYVIIEPNNSGFIDDDLQKHIEQARIRATKDFYLGNYAARKLAFPLLVPAFPRPETAWHIYTHDLDRDVMLQKGNALERIDEQLIYMFEDARKRLERQRIQTPDQFLLTGFSASGSFANRFALIHPERVFAVAAGGTSGLLMLPVDSLQQEVLRYPVGTGDLPQLVQKTFNREAFAQTPQFYFLGSKDTNDSVPYNDAFDPAESEQIIRLLGRQIQPGRWAKCQEVYQQHRINAVMKTYENIGHEHPEPVKADVVAFFTKWLQMEQ